MADNVVTLKSKKQKDPTEKVENFMTRHRKPILIAGIAVLAVALAVCVCIGVADSSRKKALAQIEEIEYAYTKDFSDLTDEEIGQRQDVALEALGPYLEKKNFAGVRANMFAADIYFARSDFSSALDSYLKAAETGAKLYTAPICYYNAAVCSEELGNNADAAAYYQSAAEDPAFTLASHALFNAARIYDSDSDYAQATELYQKLIDSHGADSWTALAQSRLVQLRIDGKTE